MRRLKNLILPIATFITLFFLASYLSVQGDEKKFEHYPYRFITDKGKFEYNLYEAKTPIQKNQGLQNQESLNYDSGMIFFENCTKPATFWMKDTLISLDLIFLDADMKVLEIKPNLQPYSEEYITSKDHVCYAVELTAGSATHMNLKVGDHFKKGSHTNSLGLSVVFTIV